MLQDDRSNAFAYHVLTDGLAQQTRDVLMGLSGKLAKLVPRGFVNLRTDLDGFHLDVSRYVKIHSKSSLPTRDICRFLTAVASNARLDRREGIR
jgi:hypothetical protein